MSELSHNIPTPHRRARPFALTATLFALGLAIGLGAAMPRAAAEPSEDDPEVIAQAKVHYKAGLDAYKLGHYDVAIRELKKAYLLKKLPPLLLNIGATYRKMGDLDLSLHFYQKFLDEAPADSKDRAEVEKIVGEIKQTKSAPAAADEGAQPKAADEGAPGKRGDKAATEWNHNLIDAAPPGSPIDVRVSTPVMKGVKVFVFYRSAGQADFNSVLMKRRGREKVGRIPGDAVSGRSLQYYIEAKDPAGTVVKSSGSQTNPNIIMVEEGVKPVLISSSGRRDEEPEEGDEENRPKKKPQRDLDAEEAPTTGKVNLSDDEPVKKAAGKAVKHAVLWTAGVGLLAGGGVLAAGGATLLVFAKQASDVLTDNSKLGIVDGQMVFFSNDPAVSTQDSKRASNGKIFNIVGITGLTVGGLAIAAGASCMIADAIGKGERAHPHKKRKKKRRVVEDDEEEETRNWYLAPGVSPTAVSVSGGFSF